MRKIYSGYCPNNHGRAFTEKPKKAKQPKNKIKINLVLEAASNIIRGR
ncbi:hypothetical protein [Pelosinus baikalensis]|uniref:Uncharacterized protein n=1 Tax=Pelosinus baikalensis TaxID=2892015 RepID=A0ABS8HXF6_9FIRM|nr:hypothetical protein [Pelosinus baikalensis]MCC5467652.1 hypothetical protein [Pelosinus baikalensis]